MPSESEQETDSLKARLKAKLKKAGVLEVDSSSDEEVKPRKNTKSASKGNYSKVHKKSDIQHRINGHSPVNSRCSTMASPASSDSDEVTSKPNHRVMRALESNESDSDSSDITHPRASCKRRPNVSSGSDEDGSDEGGSDDEETENSEAEGSDLIGSDDDDDDDVEEGSDSDACSMIDNEAEEVEGTDSGSADEEGPGDLISSSESDWEDDWISETDDLPTNHCSNPKASPNKSARSNSCGVVTSSGFASDSSDGTSEKCPICLLRFSNQEVGTPESCDHVFCAECLEQWSKNVNTCPVDRQEFTLILVRRRVGGKVVRQIRVERAESKEEEQEDPTFCEICGNSDREDRMLLCDGCDLGYHMECLNPPLTHVPIDNWYCSDCDHNNTNIAEEVDFGIDEVHELLEEAESAGTPQARPRPRPPRSSRPVRSVRTIPRTLQYERVLGQVQHALLERREARLAEPSTSSGVQSRKRKLVRPESSSKKRRRTVPRKKKSIKKKKLSTTTRKRSTKKKTTTTSTTGVKKRVGVKKKVVKKKRKTKRKLTSKSKKAKRSTRKARVPASHSVKGRLAEQLGMRPLRQPWQTTPELRSTPSISGIVLERSRAGIPALHLFGQRDQLDYFSGSDEEMGAGGGVAVVAQPRETLSLAQRLMNRKRLAASLNNPNRRLRLNEPIVSTRSDLVDSILLSQTKMLSKKTDVKINIDGSLNIVLKEPTMKPCLTDPLKDRLGENHVDVRAVSPSTTGLIVQAPMYAGGRRGQSAQNSFSGNNYSGSRRGRGTGGRGGGGAANSGNGGSVNNSSFRSSFNNPDHSRAQYEQFLGNSHGGGRPPRSQPLRFRLNAPRRPLRRNVMRRRGQQPADNEDDEEEDVLESVMESDAQDAAKDTEESGGGPKEDEEVDIYSDIEAESHKEGEDADSEYGALLPPPEPPAILMNMGGQHSDEEGSDNELVIDDKAKGPSDETDDKYDPAEPCDDSDDGNPSNPRADEIPLPPEPGPALKHVIAYSDEESGSGGVSPEKDTTTTNKGNPQDTPEDLSVSIVHPISKRSDGTCKDRNQKEAGSDLDSTKRTDPSGGEESSEDDDDDCPNFSIYSATSVNIARQVGEDESDDGKEKEIETGVDQKLPDEILPSSSSVGKSKSKHVESGAETADISIEGEDPEKKASEDSLLQVDIEKSEKKALEDSADRDESDESGSEENASSKGTAQTLVEEIFGADEDSEAATPVPAAPVMPGLEGLETETISDNEEAMLDEDLSEQESDLCSKRRRRGSDEGADFEDGEIVDETQRGKRERKRVRKDGDENADDARKSRRRRDSPSKERPPLSSSENRNRDKNKEKDKEKDKKKGRDDDKTKERGKDDIAWKKPSKSTKDRNYRDGKEKAKAPEKEREKGREDKRDDERENGRKDRKKKEKRKDLERYDVRKVLSDKTLSRQNKDAFGRDIDIRRRSRTNSRSNSRSRGRARSRSRSRSHRRTARSRSRSRSRGRSPGRARLRNRSASYDRLRQRKSRSRSRLRGSRSRQRAGNRSRSLRRSPNRSKDRARKSRSRDRMRKKSRENRLDGRDVRDMREARDLPSRARNEPMNSVTREPRRERGERGVEREMVRTQESWPRSFSRSLSRSLSRSMSGSPQYPISEDEAETLRTRSYSRSWSRERVEHVSTTDMAGGKHKTHKNLTVIVTNNKDETRRKKKEGKRGKGRYASPPPSKEVFASGDNILVSVNFKSNKSGDGVADPYALEKSSKRKRDEGRNKRTKKDRGNRTRTDTPPLDSSKPADKRRKPLPPEASQKPVAIIDLEQSPYKEFTPSPKDLIILSDSDDENMQPTEQELQQMKQKLHDEINAVPEEPLLAMGPKTPPEPQVKFSISSKNVIRTINNPLHEDEDEGGDEEAGGLEIGTSRSEVDSECIHKGPNTPPESPSGPATPGSSPTSPDAYDPFEPTASPRSESPDEGAGIGDRSNVLDKSNEPLENGSIGNLVEDESRPKTDIIDDARILSPKLDGEAASPGTTAIEVDEVDKSKPMSPSSSAEATAVKTPMKAIAAAGGSTEVTSSTSTSRSAPSRAATQTDRHLLMKGSLSVRPATKPGTPVKAIPRQNGEQSVQPDVIDMDLDSPYSPGSSEGDDLFEPPPVYSSKGTPSKTASRPKPTSGSASKTEKFDMLFGSSPRQRVKYGSTVRPKHSSKNSGRNQAKLNRIVKQMTRSRKDGAMRTTDEDQLKILDEVPSSAVELQVKDKFLKKLNRQERVVEEVKLALKPHYYKKHINKEDYKEILRRSVPKICHNKSGEINPMKIQTLVEAYVKKIRYLKKKAAIASGQLKPKASKKQTD